MEHSQGVYDDKIVVANSAAVTGAFAATGDPINAGIRAYFDMVNASGGIDGRRIEFLHVDDGYDPAKAREAFCNFFNREKVFAYVGHFGAPAVKATLSDIQQCGMPVVYFGTGIGDLYVEHAQNFAEGANCYPIQPLYITEGRVMAASAASEFHAGRVGIIYTEDMTGRDILRGMKIECGELGLELSQESVSTGGDDLKAAVSGIKASEPDVVIVAAAQEWFPVIVREMAVQKLYRPTVTTYVNAVVTTAFELMDVIQDKFEVYASGWINYEGERMEHLEEAARWMGDYAMNGYAHCGWIGAYFFCEGLRRLKGQPVTWESFRRAMEQAPIENPFGGYVDYANGQRMGTKEMSLCRLDRTSPVGWSEVYGLRSIEALTAAVK